MLMEAQTSTHAAHRLIEAISIGQDQKLGNLVGIQPFMTIDDYRSAEAFRQKLDGYLAVAQERGWLGPKSIVVLPEYVGTWLVALGEKERVYRARSIEGAMIGLILGNWKNFWKHLWNAHAKDRVKYAIFRMKAEKAAKAYHETLSSLARQYGVTLVGGSIVLPAIEVTADNDVRVGDGKLYNTTLTYRPDGTAYPEVLHKVYPTPQELPFTEPGSEDRLPVYATPAGRLGVFNCADSWYGTTYEKLAGKIDFLAVPSFVEKDDDVSKPWNGKNITPTPPEFDPNDYFRITYDDAWIKYALAARFQKARVRNGVNVFLRGKFWSLGSDGHSILIHDGKLHRGAQGAGATLQNLWLQPNS